jgi:hypothetical protein
MVASTPVDVIPAQVDQFAYPEAVQERHQRDHVVPVAVPVTLENRKQPVEFIMGQRLALAAIGLGPLDFLLYGRRGRRETSCIH